jgi:NitT/TauT family transport system substrate-binding protein
MLKRMSGEQTCRYPAVDDSRSDGTVADEDTETIADLNGKTEAREKGLVGSAIEDAGCVARQRRGDGRAWNDAGAAFVERRANAAANGEDWRIRGKESTHGRLLVDTARVPGRSSTL